jgi:hypothetical protein
MTQMNLMKTSMMWCSGWVYMLTACCLPAVCLHNLLRCVSADDAEEFGEDDYEFGDEEDEEDAEAESKLLAAAAAVANVADLLLSFVAYDMGVKLDPSISGGCSNSAVVPYLVVHTFLSAIDYRTPFLHVYIC